MAVAVSAVVMAAVAVAASAPGSSPASAHGSLLQHAQLMTGFLLIVAAQPRTHGHTDAPDLGAARQHRRVDVHGRSRCRHHARARNRIRDVVVQSRWMVDHVFARTATGAALQGA